MKHPDDALTLDLFAEQETKVKQLPFPWWATSPGQIKFYSASQNDQKTIMDELKNAVLQSHTHEWDFKQWHVFGDEYRGLENKVYWELQESGLLECRHYYYTWSDRDWVPDGVIENFDADQMAKESSGYTEQFRLVGGAA